MLRKAQTCKRRLKTHTHTSQAKYTHASVTAYTAMHNYIRSPQADGGTRQAAPLQHYLQRSYSIQRLRRFRSHQLLRQRSSCTGPAAPVAFAIHQRRRHRIFRSGSQDLTAKARGGNEPYSAWVSEVPRAVTYPRAWATHAFRVPTSQRIRIKDSGEPMCTGPAAPATAYAAVTDTRPTALPGSILLLST